MFGCQNKTDYPLEVTLDLTRAKAYRCSEPDFIISAVVAPHSYQVLAHNRKIGGASQQEEDSRLDIDFSHKRIVSK